MIVSGSIGASINSDSSSTARSRSLLARHVSDPALCADNSRGGGGERRHAPLVVLEELLLVPEREVVRHCVRPLERHAALVHDVERLLHELHLDPGQLGRDLHLLHLLLRLRVELHGQLRRLLVVRPAVVVLNGLLVSG